MFIVSPSIAQSSPHAMIERDKRTASVPSFLERRFEMFRDLTNVTARQQQTSRSDTRRSPSDERRPLCEPPEEPRNERPAAVGDARVVSRPVLPLAAQSSASRGSRFEVRSRCLGSSLAIGCGAPQIIVIS